MKTLYCLIVVFGLGFKQHIFAQGGDSLLIEAVQSNTYQLTLNDQGEFEGSALNMIKDAVEYAQFLLVGEQHGIAEVATFTGALLKEAKPHGFSYFCIETDPYVATKLRELATSDSTSILTFFDTYPMSVPFYSGKEDFELIQHAINLFGNHENMLWGVDQVFMGSDRYIFSLLDTDELSEEARALAKDYLQKGMDGFSEMKKTGNPSTLLMNSLEKSDFETLRQAIGKNANPIYEQMIHDLELSQAIYQLWMQGKYYENNLARVQLMKSQFMEHYRAALKKDPVPKVLFKFGQTHTYRGLSMYDQFDLGNLVSELAEMNQSKSVHFAVSGIKGKAQDSFGPPRDFDHIKDMNPSIFKAIEPLLNDSKWIVIDLHTIRKTLPSSHLKPIQQMVFGYDFWVYIPNAYPAGEIGQMNF